MQANSSGQSQRVKNLVSWLKLFAIIKVFFQKAKNSRVPEILQMEATECGVACLVMILNYYGLETTIGQVRERCGVGRDGLSALAIVKAARSYGLRVKGLSIQQNDFRFVRLPLIVHWQFNHFVVLEHWSPKQVEIVDPAFGRQRLSAEEFEANFTGVVITLEPGSHFKRQQKRPPLSLSSYLRYLTHTPGLIAQIIIVSIVLQLLGLALPLFTRVVVDLVVPSGLNQVMPVIGAGMLVLVLAFLVTTLLRSALLVYLQARLDMRIMLSFFEHLLSLPYRFFQQRSSGDLLSRMSSNLIIRDTLTGQLLSVLLDSGLVLVYLIILCWQSLVFGAVVLAVGLAQVILLLVSARPLRELTKRDLGAQGKAQGYMNEALNGIASIKAAGAEPRTMNYWSNLFFDQLNVSMRRNYLAALVETLIGSLRTFSPLALLWFGTGAVLDGKLSLGTMLGLNALAISCLTPLASLVSSAQRLQLVRAHFDRLSDLQSAQPEQFPGEVMEPPRLSGQIELRNVSFRYDQHSPEVLHDINLKLASAQKIALVGKSGSGKSTLAKLLLGLYLPTEGEILYDDLPLSKLNYQAVRSQFGVVLQDAFIFSGSVRQNIAYNNPELPLEQIVEAAKMAALHDDLVQMPMGYETFVAEGGSALSGGQRQRLALARALAHFPSVLLLDEATSHLDVLTEQAVDRSLNELQYTRIVIAHRLSTIQNADLIVVLDQGRIVEQGRHDDLLALGGYYTQLIASNPGRQSLEAA